LQNKLLDIAKEIAEKAARALANEYKTESKNIQKYELSGREVKIAADKITDQIIVSELSLTGISILSEESGFIDLGNKDDLLWIVDPLDGSVNFLRNLGPSFVSIALWNGSSPVFGVLCDISNFIVTYGGLKIGSWSNNNSLKISNATDIKKSILCTGLPARFDYEDLKMTNDFNKIIFSYSKVRMLGSAAYSLLKVASGDADAYYESNIMLWDIAAGLALIQGSGGSFNCEINWDDFNCTAYASNNNLLAQQ
jgi:myo-inositol-1(or 4)-monophosphatase